MEERFPVKLISEGGTAIEKPSIIQVLNEVDMVLRNPVKTAYHLLSNDCDPSDAESLLFVTLAHWDRISNEIARVLESQKRHWQNAWERP